MIRLLIFIILASAIILFEFTISYKIAVFGIRPNLILVFLIIVAPLFFSREDPREKSSVLKIKQWQKFLVLGGVAGFIFDALSIDRTGGFYFASFLVIAALIYLFFSKSPFKNIFLNLISAIIFVTFLFNLIVGQNIFYLISKQHLVEIIYNTAVLIIVWLFMNFKKIIKMIRL